MLIFFTHKMLNLKFLTYKSIPLKKNHKIISNYHILLDTISYNGLIITRHVKNFYTKKIKNTNIFTKITTYLNVRVFLVTPTIKPIIKKIY